MEHSKIITLQFRLTRRNALLMLTVFFLCWRPRSLGSEQLTITTYYPAPYGAYASLLTTGQTLLARDGGNVGIGTSYPQAKLHISGIPGTGVGIDISATDTGARFRMGIPPAGGLRFHRMDVPRINILVIEDNGDVSVGYRLCLSDGCKSAWRDVEVPSGYCVIPGPGASGCPPGYSSQLMAGGGVSSHAHSYRHYGSPSCTDSRCFINSTTGQAGGSAAFMCCK